jgi:hypothetical protein
MCICSAAAALAAALLFGASTPVAKLLVAPLRWWGIRTARMFTIVIRMPTERVNSA